MKQVPYCGSTDISCHHANLVSQDLCSPAIYYLLTVLSSHPKQIFEVSDIKSSRGKSCVFHGVGGLHARFSVKTG